MRVKAFHSWIIRLRHSFVVFAHDVLVIPIAWLGALWLRFNLGEIPVAHWQAALSALPVVILIQTLSYHIFGLYRGVWRFASMPDLLRIFKAVLTASLFIVLTLFFFNRLESTPRSVFPLYAMMLIMILGGARFVFRWLKDYGRLLKGKRVLIVGAGRSGESLVRDMLRTENEDYLPVAFIDDQASRQGFEIQGIRVVGKIADLESVAHKFAVDLVVIAQPNASSVMMRDIVSRCEQAQVEFRTLPSLNDLTSGRVNIATLREVSLEDLLGRDPVSLDWEAINASLQNKRVLVTGGAGSIGSELCRQIAKLSPRQLMIVDNSEFNLYKLQLEIERDFPGLNYSIHLVDVTDTVAISSLMQHNNLDVVFHAAAYKHVPMLESQIRVAVRNNILGTYNVATAAVAANVPKFVLISTDKAVHPVNVMGATKRAAEIICQNLNSQVSTQFITVRFGNVLGSAGSVVPLFKQQIASGGPITVTDPEITRFFMTIPEASQLILQATVLAKGGEIFVLDMGEPVKISFLAEQMIRLAGLEPHKDIAIKYIGLRPGEKLYEELFHQHESLLATQHKKILLAKYRENPWHDIKNMLECIDEACVLHDSGRIQQLVCQLVPEYSQKSEEPNKNIIEAVGVE